MSAKWRRGKKNTRRFDLFKAISRAKSKDTHRRFNIKTLKVKRQSHPYMYRVPKVDGEVKCRELKPLVDVFEEKDEVVVVAELAGFNRENQRISVKSQRLTLSAEGSDRKFYKSLNLPERVIPSTMRTTYKNGVLEIHLKKVVEEKAIDRVAG